MKTAGLKALNQDVAILELDTEVMVVQIKEDSEGMVVQIKEDSEVTAWLCRLRKTARSLHGCAD